MRLFESLIDPHVRRFDAIEVDGTFLLFFYAPSESVKSGSELLRILRYLDQERYLADVRIAGSANRRVCEALRKLIVSLKLPDSEKYESIISNAIDRSRGPYSNPVLSDVLLEIEFSPAESWDVGNDYKMQRFDSKRFMDHFNKALDRVRRGDELKAVQLFGLIVEVGFLALAAQCEGDKVAVFVENAFRAVSEDAQLNDVEHLFGPEKEIYNSKIFFIEHGAQGKRHLGLASFVSVLSRETTRDHPEEIRERMSQILHYALHQIVDWQGVHLEENGSSRARSFGRLPVARYNLIARALMLLGKELADFRTAYTLLDKMEDPLQLIEGNDDDQKLRKLNEALRSFGIDAALTKKALSDNFRDMKNSNHGKKDIEAMARVLSPGSARTFFMNMKDERLW